MGAKYVQEFGSRILDMSSASGYMGARYFKDIGLGLFGMSQIFDMSPSAVNFQFEVQFGFPDPAEHYVWVCSDHLYPFRGLGEVWK